MKKKEGLTYTEALQRSNFLTQNAKILAWGLFLFFFIENGTLGLVPRQFYFVYRNMRISDFLLYGLTLYSFYNIKEFLPLYKSKAFLLPKLLLTYFIFQFIFSFLKYDYNLFEFFFRLKGLWMCFLVFPFLLLLKRNGLGYLIKLMLPVAVVSNILYIMSAVTGTAFLPDIGIAEQSLPGGLKVFRVYGGTFYGELFFLGFIYTWMTKKFRVYQLFLAVLFIVPHILAFGRSAWIYFAFTVVVMLVWYALKQKEFRAVLRQIIIVVILGTGLIYGLVKFVPQSDYLISAIDARVSQGQEDLKYKEGTYGSRLANIAAMLTYWESNNIFIGIGMHPLWVVSPVTAEESIYAWGFSDVGWASVLVAYGLVGFILAILFQVYYFVTSIKIVKNTTKYDLLVFFILVFISKLFYDSVINYSYMGLTVGLWGFWSTSISIAALVYKYENPDEEFKF
ncbi:MAG TPA: O-antigen ligase family protein [Ignavibacteria bacterium]|nr:O-antigen ligase family protein [Ignavibacteria bacterium]